MLPGLIIREPSNAVSDFTCYVNIELLERFFNPPFNAFVIEISPHPFHKPVEPFTPSFHSIFDYPPADLLKATTYQSACQ